MSQILWKWGLYKPGFYMKWTTCWVLWISYAWGSAI